MWMVAVACSVAPPPLADELAVRLDPATLDLLSLVRHSPALADRIIGLQVAHQTLDGTDASVELRALTAGGLTHAQLAAGLDDDAFATWSSLDPSEQRRALFGAPLCASRANAGKNDGGEALVYSHGGRWRAVSVGWWYR